MAGKNLYYFVSDVHLGLNYKNAQERERNFARFLNSMPSNTKAVYLLGDIFDFWYEYKNVIPRKFTRTLGALSALVDRGVEVYFFNGNHDIWTYNYFEKEIGVKMLNQPYVVDIEGRTFCLGHGDGLGKGDTGYKILNSVFKCRFLQVLFSAIHPRIAFELAHKWSLHNRISHESKPHKWRGEDEQIVRYANDFQQQSNVFIDYFIFGHYHYETQMNLKNGGELFLLGEWIHKSNYIVFDGETVYSKNIE